jgi:hypothetical protein
MNCEVGGLDENIGPNASHQILPADQLSVVFKQRNQDLQSATSERHRLIAFQQQKLRRKQTKGSEQNSCWRCAGCSSSFFEQWSGSIGTLNGASDVELRFEMKLLRASESRSRSHNDLTYLGGPNPRKDQCDVT